MPACSGTKPAVSALVRLLSLGIITVVSGFPDITVMMPKSYAARHVTHIRNNEQRS
jgi:hypothetical protein